MLKENPEENIIIADREKVEQIIERMREDGPAKLHILSDFDKTLTRAFYFGTKFQSVISQLRDGGYLTPDYADRAYKLYDKYAPIEGDPDVPMQEKIANMQEWWETHFTLLIECGFSRQTIDELVENSDLKFREYAFEIFDLLNKHNVPLVIMSAAPGDILEEYFRRTGRFYENIYMISNHYEFDEEGNATGIIQPIIHSMNKHEIVIRDFPIFEQIRNRKNVILLGDSLGDPGMIKGFDSDYVLHIGFLNDDIEKLLPHYKKIYDIIILNDGSMEEVLKILNQITS